MKIFSKKFLICFFDFRGEVLKSAKSDFCILSLELSFVFFGLSENVFFELTYDKL